MHSEVLMLSLWPLSVVCMNMISHWPLGVVCMHELGLTAPSSSPCPIKQHTCRTAGR